MFVKSFSFKIILLLYFITNFFAFQEEKRIFLQLFTFSTVDRKGRLYSRLGGEFFYGAENMGKNALLFCLFSVDARKRKVGGFFVSFRGILFSRVLP